MYKENSPFHINSIKINTRNILRNNAFVRQYEMLMILLLHWIYRETNKPRTLDCYEMYL